MHADSCISIRWFWRPALSTRLVLILAMFLLGCLPAVAQPADRIQIDLDQLARAASIVGAPLLRESTAPREMDFDGEWARMWRIYQSRDWSIENPALANVWLDIQEQARQCLLVLTAIAKIDANKPSGVDIFLKILRNNDTQDQRDDRDLTILERMMQEYNKSQLIDKFNGAEARLYRSIGALSDVGSNLSRRNFGNAITVAYLPSWQGVFSSDMLVVRNVSGATFENAAMAVTVHERNGNSTVHVHYIDRWQNGSELNAYYAYESGEYAGPKAAGSASSVDVAVFTRYGTATATYALTPQEWDRIVGSYCSQLKFKGHFLGEYVESETNMRYAPGFQFSFAGLRKLPVKTVVVHFWSDDAGSQSVQWDVNGRLEPNEIYDYRSELFQGDRVAFGNASPPKHVAITLQLFGTNYEPRIDFY